MSIQPIKTWRSDLRIAGPLAAVVFLAVAAVLALVYASWETVAARRVIALERSQRLALAMQVKEERQAVDEAVERIKALQNSLKEEERRREEQERLRKMFIASVKQKEFTSEWNTIQWFNNAGEPLVWYSGSETEGYRLWGAPGFDPDSGKELRSVGDETTRVQIVDSISAKERLLRERKAAEQAENVRREEEQRRQEQERVRIEQQAEAAKRALEQAEKARREEAQRRQDQERAETERIAAQRKLEQAEKVRQEEAQRRQDQERAETERIAAQRKEAEIARQIAQQQARQIEEERRAKQARYLNPPSQNYDYPPDREVHVSDRWGLPVEGGGGRGYSRSGNRDHQNRHQRYLGERKGGRWW